jgi:hypothetical protein
MMKSLFIYYFIQVLNLLLLSDRSYCSYCLAFTVRERRKETKKRGKFKVGSYFSYCLASIVLTVLLLLVLIFLTILPFYCLTVLIFLIVLQIGENIIVFALIVLIV